MTGFEEAKDRAEFCLTYDRCDPREFSEDLLMGPSIPNAFGDGLAPGDWQSGEWPAEDADEETCKRMADLYRRAVRRDAELIRDLDRRLEHATLPLPPPVDQSWLRVEGT
jgi:hypothetical protein